MSPRREPTLDVDRLTRWMDQQGLGEGDPLEHRLLSGGAQNDIFELHRGDMTCVLRIPPPTAPAERDEGILREWRIIEALDGTDVPHAAAVGLCEDPSVLGRTFYLMGLVDGWSPVQLRDRRWPAPFDEDLDARRGLALQLVDGVVAMSRVDWRARGLGDLGRPEGFHERQVDRWTAFFERIKGRELPGFAEAESWLRAHQPLDFVPGLMHGDYQFANVMFGHGGPARLAAVVDWEMGTIGDPKLDLAWAVHSWPDGDGAGPQAIAYVDMTGMPRRTELLEHFARHSGRQVEDMDYYFVLAKWKLALMLEQTFQRARPGTPLEAFGPIAAALMREAADLAESSDYGQLAVRS